MTLLLRWGSRRRCTTCRRTGTGNLRFLASLSLLLLDLASDLVGFPAFERSAHVLEHIVVDVREIRKNTVIIRQMRRSRGVGNVGPRAGNSAVCHCHCLTVSSGHHRLVQVGPWIYWRETARYAQRMRCMSRCQRASLLCILIASRGHRSLIQTGP